MPRFSSVTSNRRVQSSNRPGKILWLGGLLLTALLFAGCNHLSYSDPNPEQPFVFPGSTPVTPGGATNGLDNPPIGTSGTLRPNESLKIQFSDLPPPGLPEQQVRISNDGKITLYLNVTVLAAEKTPRQLEEDIRNAYVPRYYKRLTVTVKTDERFYYVGGEVRLPSRYVYVGQITVLRALDSAGGFTAFANRKKIELRRGGKIFKINWSKAIEKPSLDMEVLPNDQIVVYRRSY